MTSIKHMLVGQPQRSRRWGISITLPGVWVDETAVVARAAPFHPLGCRETSMCMQLERLDDGRLDTVDERDEHVREQG